MPHLPNDPLVPLQTELDQMRLERDQLITAFNHVPALFAITSGAEHRFVYTNPLYRKTIGDRSLEGLTIREALPELAGQGFFELLDQVFASGEPFIGNEVSALLDRLGNGELDQGFFNFIYQPMLGADGKSTGVLIHAVEVTDLVRSREHVQRGEDRFRSLVQATSQLVWTTDARGQVTDIPEWRAYTGQSVEEVAGAGWIDAVHPEDRPHAAAAWSRASEKRKFYEVEYRLRHRDGHYRWFVARGTPVLEPDGSVREWIGTCTDVHEQKRTADSLAAAQAEVAASEQRYRQLAEAMPQLVFVSRPDGYHDYFNQRWYDYTGLAHGCSDGEGWQAVLHPEDLGRTTALWRRSLETGEPYEVEHRFRRHDGEYRWFVGRALPGRDEAGRIVKWYGTLTDIHDQKLTEAALQQANETLAMQQEEMQLQAEELQAQQEELQMQTEELQSQQITLAAINAELQTSEARFRQLANAAPQIVWSAGPNGAADYYNDRTASYTGLAAQALLADGWQAIVHAEDLPRVAASWAHSVATGEPFEHEFRLRRHDGEHRWHIGRALPMRDEAGGILRWHGTCTDIHDQKRTEESLKLANDELVRLSAQAQAANKLKSEFLANMSHELRTPLNSIIGYTELVLAIHQHALEPQVQANMEVVLRNARHLLSLINDVLDLSKIEAGKATVYPEPFDPRLMIEAILGTVEPLARERGLQLAAHVAPGLEWVVSDETKVRQIVLNLVTNALKFTREGGVDVTLEPRGSDLWAIIVQDTGIGIAKEHHEVIFQEFRQVDASSTRQAGGTGLGLSIARGLARLLGGRLTLESVPGVGSTFTVELPCEFRPERQPAARPATPVEPPRAGRGRTVVAIDDDPEALALIMAHLQGTDITVVPASDGETGLRLARELRPAAITLDILMPGLSGWQVLRDLKNDPITRGIPVAVLSFVDNKTLGFSLGAASYLTKPIEREQLVAEIERLAPAVGHEEGYVLVVEDDPDARTYIRQLLTPGGLKVLEAADGEAALAALEVLSPRRPALVILDLGLPHLDGFEVMARLRADRTTHDVPVIVVTGRDLTPEDLARLGDARYILPKGTLAEKLQVQDLRALLLETAGASLKQEAP